MESRYEPRMTCQSIWPFHLFIFWQAVLGSRLLSFLSCEIQGLTPTTGEGEKNLLYNCDANANFCLCFLSAATGGVKS
ncbi:unnamed protein product [Prunus armeniaca]|uniref:Uncharacterized protein n=1 Tax=Prunus armeniaca TaxID=36596 RepID=A0A6J5TE28_PRUAR|nr:unnamed protein product [Prunus armeniaca]